ncbi:type IV pilus modification protein PilV [Ectothiorhodospiraceae bacterium 2226]|nr:type IV pilus modification protein PilV [Ectothiorhodospiraceae bacterium 2226]
MHQGRAARAAVGGARGIFIRSVPRPGGYSLLELLIALLVVSGGLLGFAALHVQALQHNHTAQLRTQATLLSTEIIDVMRANRAAAATGAYNIDVGATPSGGDLAGAELQAWKAALARNLPQGDGSIAVSTSGREIAVTVRVEWRERWREHDDEDTPEPPMAFVWSSAL